MDKLNPVIEELLRMRGIEGKEEIEEYFSDKPKKTYDPSLLLNLDAAVERILKAIESGEKICIYGDYDADGISSTAILCEILSMLMPKERLCYHIPSRFSEGYGLNNTALDEIKEAGVGLVVTVDCGCVSVGEVEHAKELGMDIIVSDHHSMDEGRMPSCLIVNPKQKNCPYPYKGLAGCGVAFKIAQAIQRKSGLPKSAISGLLDLCAIGTIGDVMPLTGENRTMVKYGLKLLKNGRRAAFKALMEGVQLKPERINAENIAFTIVPQLNAAGRMGDASLAEELLLESDPLEIANKAGLLLKANQERKDIQDGLYADCVETVENELLDKNIIIVNPKNSHEGIAGIVAGRLRDRYYLPAILLSDSGSGMLKGTGRSIEGIDIHELLSGHIGLFEKFGGHAAACGFSMKKENFPAFREIFENEADMRRRLEPEIFERPILFDLDLCADDISIELCEDIERMEPFGKDNPKPLFRLKDVEIKYLQFMGQEGNHAKFKLPAPDGFFEAVLFSRAREYEGLLKEGKTVDIIGSPEISEWNGNKRVQFIIKEME